MRDSPSSQPASEEKKLRERQAGRENERWGRKLEAIGMRWENVCFSTFLYVCTGLFFVCTKVGNMRLRSWNEKDSFMCVCERRERIISELSGFSCEQRRTKGSVLVQEAQLMADAAIWGVLWWFRLQLPYQLLWPIHTHTLSNGWLSDYSETHNKWLHS